MIIGKRCTRKCHVLSTFYLKQTFGVLLKRKEVQNILEKYRKYRTQDGNKHYNEKREKLNSKAYNLVAIIQCVHVQSEQKERKHFKS